MPPEKNRAKALLESVYGKGSVREVDPEELRAYEESMREALEKEPRLGLRRTDGQRALGGLHELRTYIVEMEQRLDAALKQFEKRLVEMEEHRG